MAIITTREIGATAIQIPLSNAQLDNNFINLNADIATRVPASEKGAVNGVATLDASGLVPTAQLPSYVDDVLEAANFEAFPASGETGKIYVALDTNKTYRWSGSAYIYITSGAVDSVAGKTGVVTLVKADVGLANVDNTSDADKPVSTATQTALNTKQAALGYTPVNKAGDTITGDLLNSAAYSAPNSESGAGTRLRIRGSTGTGAAGAAGGNGYVEILGGGATSVWESFAGSATRGGVLVQSGTAQGDAGNTYVAGSSLQLRAGAGTTNGTQVGFGGTVNIYAGNTTRTDGNTSSGGGLTLWGGRGTQSGYFALGGGAMGFGNDFASTQSGGISSYPGTLTEGGETNISGGGYSTGSAQSYTTNTGGYIVLKGATATTGGDIAFYPGSVYEGIAGGVNGTVKVNNNIVLHAGNYSSYAQPLLVSGTTIKTINGTSVLGSGDIVISSGPPGSTYLPLAGGTMTGALTVAYTVESPSDSTATALSYGRLQGFGHIHINADTDQSTTEFVYITAGYATASSSSANGLAVGNSTLTWKDNAVLHAGNYNSYALPLSGGTVSGYTTFSANVNMTSTDSYLPGHFFTNTHDGTNVYFHVGGSGSTTNKILNLRVLNNSGGNSLYQFDVNRLDAPNLQINGNQVLHAGNYSSYVLPLSGGTLTGKIILPSAIADRPQLFGGFLGMDSGDADVDIWGISRDYYPSNGTAANAWGIAWNAEANQIRFIGGGNTRLSIDLDGGASGLAWDGNAVLNSSNYTDYKPPLLAPINATSTSISNWNPQSLTYQAWGQAFVNSNISADSGDVTWWLRASQYLAGGTELCMIIDGDYYAGTGQHKVLHAGNYSSYALSLSGGNISGPVNINAGNADGSNDGSLYITATNNTDWGLIVNKYNGDATEYGVDIRVGSSANYALRINGNGGEVLRVTGAGNLISTGTISAASKSFLIPHPTKPGLQLRYGSLEGPENGVYVRGKLKGINKIQLPEYWTKLVDPDSITVTLTPVGKHQRLYVESIADNTVTVANDGLFAGEINCFFVVYAERVDIDKLVVECE